MDRQNIATVIDSLYQVCDWDFVCFVSDYNQYEIGVCEIDEIACRVMTRVVSHCPRSGHLLVDCGFTALGHDGINIQDTLPFGLCIFQDHPKLRYSGIHWTKCTLAFLLEFIVFKLISIVCVESCPLKNIY